MNRYDIIAQLKPCDHEEYKRLRESYHFLKHGRTVYALGKHYNPPICWKRVDAAQMWTKTSSEFAKCLAAMVWLTE